MKNDIRRSFEKIKSEEGLKQSTRESVLNKLNEKPKPRRNFQRFSLAVAAAAFIFFIGAGSFQMYFSESSYIDMDVNPSIELSVNRFDRVIRMSAYNKDGKEVLSELNLKHKSYKDAVALILKKIKEKGYLKQNGMISVTVQGKDREKASEIKTLQTEIDQCISEHGGRQNVEVYAVSKRLKKKSHHLNVTPAKYLAIKELQKVDQTATVEKCRDHSISEIKDYTKQCEEGHENSHGNSQDRQQGGHHGSGGHHGEH